MVCTVLRMIASNMFALLLAFMVVRMHDYSVAQRTSGCAPSLCSIIIYFLFSGFFFFATQNILLQIFTESPGQVNDGQDSRNVPHVLEAC